jgi:hypothetical protein
MDQETLNVQRFEAEGRASFDRWSVSMMYGNYAPQPELGYLTRREGFLGSASVKVAANWVVSGSADGISKANKVNQYIVGAGLRGRLLRAGGELCHVLQLFRRHHAACAQSRVHAADRLANHCQYGHGSGTGGHPIEPAPGMLPEEDFLRVADPIRIGLI